MPNNIDVQEYDPEFDPGKDQTWYKLHVPPHLSPLVQSINGYVCAAGQQDAAEHFQIPNSRGWDYRTSKDSFYVMEIPVTDPEELRQREETFKQRLIPFLADYDKEWGSLKEEMDRNHARLRSLDLAGASLCRLRQYFEEAYAVARRHWYIHFYSMYPVGAAFGLLGQLLQQMLGMGPNAPEYRELMQGFDNRMFETDRRMWNLSRLAQDLELQRDFNHSHGNALLEWLEQGQKGKQWVSEFRKFLETDGWRCDHFYEVSRPSWLEDPTMPLDHINAYMAMSGDFSLDAIQAKKAREREETQAKLILRIPEDQRPFMTLLINLAQKFQAFNEEHAFWIENPTHVELRMIALEIGKRFVAAGAMDEVDDIFYLTYMQILRSCAVIMRHNLRPLVAARLARYEETSHMDLPPMLGEPRPAVDVLLQTVTGQGVIVEPQPGADLTGVPGAPGIAEGVARLVKSVEHIGTIRDREILVAWGTTVAWTPVFGRIKGVVTDVGGILSHAAIVAREYGIPAVVCTGNASKKISTGDVIRIDGAEGTVTIVQPVNP